MAEIVPSSIAIWRPFSGKGSTPLTHDIICVHTMVGSLLGSWNYANTPGNAYWHFGTSGLGEAWQCHDLRHRSAANLNGNHRIIPIENADMGPGFEAWNSQCGNVPPFTQAQVNKLIDLIEWLCRRYNIPAALIPDTMPGRRGIAYHRQGINPWRCGSCELWSNATGKCCPDWRRIAQLVDIIIPAVQRRLSGQPIEEEEYYDMYAMRSEGRPWAICSDSGEVHLFGPDWLVGPYIKPGDKHRPDAEYWAAAKARAFWTGMGYPPDLLPGEWDAAVEGTRQRRRKVAQQVWFVNDPASDGVFLVYGSVAKLLFPATTEGRASLADHQAHWAFQGYDTTVYTWTDNDINIVPEVGASPPP